jgi:hypothetical protein
MKSYNPCEASVMHGFFFVDILHKYLKATHHPRSNLSALDWFLRKLNHQYLIAREQNQA